MAGLPDQRNDGAQTDAALTYARPYALFTLVGIAAKMTSMRRISMRPG